MAVVKKWARDSNFDEWMDLAEFLHANTNLRKLKVTYWGGHAQIWVCSLGHRTL